TLKTPLGVGWPGTPVETGPWRAGLARARSEGKRLGRPPTAPALEKRIREALATPGGPVGASLPNGLEASPRRGSGPGGRSSPRPSSPPCRRRGGFGYARRWLLDACPENAVRARAVSSWPRLAPGHVRYGCGRDDARTTGTAPHKCADRQRAAALAL